MTKPDLTEAEAEALVTAMLPLLHLSIEPDWRPDIVANLQALASAAGKVLDFEPARDVEPAPIFKP